MSHASSTSTERPEQLGIARATASTTTVTVSKDAVDVANTEVPEQVFDQVPVQEALEQVAPEQSLPGTPSEKQVPRTNQSVPEQTTATTCSTQGGLPDTAARGKSAATSSLAGLHQERKQTGAEQAAESDDDVIEEIQGHPQDGQQHVYVCREHGDHYVCHEEISIDEETERVERAARQLIGEVQ
jgi:hypothetical protein